MTALAERLESTAASIADYDGAAAPTDFGDVGAEYRALTTGAALVAVPQRRNIRVDGDERVDYLQGQLTSDVRSVAPGGGQAALLLSAQGRVESLLALYDGGDCIEIATDATQLESTLARVQQFIVADDVEIEADEEAESPALALIGPRAGEVLRGLGASPQAGVGGWSRSEVSLLGMPAVVCGRADLQVPVLELRCADPLRVWDAAAALGAVPAGSAALEIVRIESGAVRFGRDVDDSRIAMEARLEWAIHFAKGCYVGQEIIERAVSRGRLNRQIALLACDAGTVVGASVDGENEKCVVTSVADSPAAGNLCFAYLPVERGDAGSTVSIDGRAARVLPWPRETIFTGRGS